PALLSEQPFNKPVRHAELSFISASRSSGRTRARKRLEPRARRALLLDAAERAFTTHGVESTRVEDAAAQAEVATGLLYRYFSSKEDLLDALMRRRADVFHERMRGRLEQLDTQQQPPAVLVAEGLRVWLEQVIADVAAGRWVTRTEAAPCARFRQQ